MAKKIDEIQGIGPLFAEKLAAAGVSTVEVLLREGASKPGRKKLADTTGIDEAKILNWVNKADLFRVKGIGPQFSELLEAAGVDTIKELRNRNAENLHSKLVEVQAEKGLTRAVPSAGQVAEYIEFAKNLEPVVTH